MWQMFTRTRAHARNTRSGLSTRERASFSAARDLRDTELACDVFGPAHKNLHALATAATEAMTTVDNGSSDHRIASHVARERTTKVIPQIQCAPCHARSLSVHGIFIVPLPAPPTIGDPRSTHLHARPTLRPARNAHRPSPPQSPYYLRLSSCSCTVVHESNAAAER